MERLKRAELVVPVSGMKSVPDPEVSAQPKRRRLSAEYKLRILKEVDNCTEPGGIGAILRREGLYSSHLTDWRRQRDKGALSALGKRRGPKPKKNPLADENDRLRRENGHLQQRLEQAETIISVQKKVASLLGIPLNPPKFDGSGS